MFYLGLDGRIMAVSVSAGNGAFETSEPSPLFRVRTTRSFPAGSYDVSADGKRFFVVSPTEEQQAAPVHLVVNWTAGLRR